MFLETGPRGPGRVFFFGGGEGSGGRKKYSCIPKCEGRLAGTSPQCVPCSAQLFKTRDLELPMFEGSLLSCSPQAVGYNRTSVDPYFPWPISET